MPYKSFTLIRYTKNVFKFENDWKFIVCCRQNTDYKALILLLNIDEFVFIKLHILCYINFKCVFVFT